MLLSGVVKVISAVAGGATIIGTPFLLKSYSSSKLISVEIIGKNNCKALISSWSEKKIIAVCDGVSSTANVEFLFVNNDGKAKLENPKKVTAFQEGNWEGKDYKLKFTIESTHQSSPMTIKVSKKHEAQIKQLKDVDLAKCQIINAWQDPKNKEVQCNAKPEDGTSSSSSLRISLMTYY